MIAKGITRAALEFAAAQIGVTVNVTSLNQKDTRHRVKVNPSDFKNENGDRNYQRISLNFSGTERRVFAVCWHGFRDYFRACFEQYPDAVFSTALDTWAGSADFEARFPVSGHTNIGSQVQPLSVCAACRCPDSGIAG